MLTLSNVLSISRAGFALLFLQSNVALRLAALVLAAFSDFLDGFIARKTKTQSQLGALLDPMMDKFFVFFVGGVFFLEQKLSGLDLVALISRDLALCVFGIYLLFVKGWKGYECKGILWGKLITFAQFIVLIGLTLNFVFPVYVYLLFVAMSIFALLELVTSFKRKSNS